MVKAKSIVVFGLCLVLGAATPWGIPKKAEAQGIFSANPNIFVDLAKKVVPSVVNISTFSSRGSPYGDESMRRFFEEWFGGPGNNPFGPGPGQPQQPRGKGKKAQRRQLSLGTGFIIDQSGLIVTNNHVIGEADEIQIKFTEDEDEAPTDAEVIGKDQGLDIALLKVKTKRKLRPLKLGNSDNLQVGEYVAAVGNPFGRGHSVTHGIVSAKHRTAPGGLMAKYIQTDAPINPGNSGGPLVNLNGEVVGVNNAIDARAQGIGFSIPINEVKRILPQLKTKGLVERGYIGVLVSELTPEIAGQVGAPKNLKAPFVTHVDEDQPAAKAGVKPYDVITEFNGRRVKSSNDLVLSVTSVPVDGSAKMKILRKGKERVLDITVAKRPDSPNMAKWRQKRERKSKSQKSKVYTGLALESLSERHRKNYGIKKGTKALMVSSVDYGSPAESSGLRRGDIILEVNQTKVGSVPAFNRIVNKKKSYLLRVQRNNVSGQPVYRVFVLDLKA